MPYSDGFMPDGTPVYFAVARGNGKPTLQLEIYRKLLGISDEEWSGIVREARENLGCPAEE